MAKAYHSKNQNTNCGHMSLSLCSAVVPGCKKGGVIKIVQTHNLKLKIMFGFLAKNNNLIPNIDSEFRIKKSVFLTLPLYFLE